MNNYHDRICPKEYRKCLRPNTKIKNQKIILKPRKVPLTKEDVIICEKNKYY